MLHYVMTTRHVHVCVIQVIKQVGINVFQKQLVGVVVVVALRVVVVVEEHVRTLQVLHALRVVMQVHQAQVVVVNNYHVVHNALQENAGHTAVVRDVSVNHQVYSWLRL